MVMTAIAWDGSAHRSYFKSEKPSPGILKKLTESAKGQPCWLKFEDICKAPDTVVYAHFRDLATGFGLGLKGYFGCPACSSCHDEADRRTTLLELDFVKSRHGLQSLRFWHYVKDLVWKIL
jgi:hypothetical protein